MIKAVTGHRSEALDSYKRQTNEKLVKVSKIVQGLANEDTRTGESLTVREIPNGLRSITLNIPRENCNITIDKN